MKFKGNGAIWNPKTQTMDINFDEKSGIFETEDPKLIERCKKLGYPEVKESEEAPAPEKKETAPAGKTKADDPGKDSTDGKNKSGSETLPEDFQELRKLAKEAGIPDYLTKTKVELIELLK